MNNIFLIFLITINSIYGKHISKYKLLDNFITYEDKVNDCTLSYKSYILKNAIDNKEKLNELGKNILNNYKIYKFNKTCILISTKDDIPSKSIDNCKNNNLSSLIDINGLTEYKHLINVLDIRYTYLVGIKKNSHNEIYYKTLIAKNNNFSLIYDTYTNNRYYICQFKLNSCENNKACGEKGKCIFIPHLNDFKCSCHIFYEGAYCNYFSSNGFQMLITIMLILSILFGYLLLKFFHYLFTPSIKPKESSNIKFNEKTIDMIKSNYIEIIITILGFLMGYFIFNLGNFKLIDYNLNNSIICKYKNNIIKDYLFAFVNLIITIIIYIIYFTNNINKHDVYCNYKIKYLGDDNFSFKLLRDRFKLCTCQTNFIIPFNMYSRVDRYKKSIIFLCYSFIIFNLLLQSIFDLSEYTIKSIINDNGMLKSFLDMQIELFNKGVLTQLLVKILYSLTSLLHFYSIMLYKELNTKNIFITLIIMLYSHTILIYYLLLNNCDETNSMIKLLGLKLKKFFNVENIPSILENTISNKSIDVYKIENTISNTINNNNRYSIFKINNIEYLPIYISLCIMCLFIIYELIISIVNYIKKQNKIKDLRNIDFNEINSFNNLTREIKYVKKLLVKPKCKNLKFIEKIYKNNSYYKFPLIIFLTNLLIIIILYTLTVSILTKSFYIIDLIYALFILTINYIWNSIYENSHLSKTNFNNTDLLIVSHIKHTVLKSLNIEILENIIFEACIFTIFTISIQQFLYIKIYKNSVMQINKGKYDIKKNNIAVDSFGYIPHVIGKTVYAYILLFFMWFCVMGIFRLMYYITWLRNWLIIILVPFLVLYIFIKIVIKIIEKYLYHKNIYNLVYIFQIFFQTSIILFTTHMSNIYNYILTCIYKCRMDYSTYSMFEDLPLLSHKAVVIKDANENNNIKKVFEAFLIDSLIKIRIKKINCKQNIYLRESEYLNKDINNSKKLYKKWFKAYTMIRNKDYLKINI